jgi:hypothetical protein
MWISALTIPAVHDNPLVLSLADDVGAQENLFAFLCLRHLLIFSNYSDAQDSRALQARRREAQGGGRAAAGTLG